ncbi:MAG TPA: DMT family transporter [Pseudonocardia sp.]|jgi:hypothetical protein|nr:DMT family transporter [Pseudonocardia sp.]
MATFLAVVFALLSAVSFAVAWVAQQRAASAVPDEEARGLRLILRLIRRPVWWAGTVGDTAAFVLQAVALGFGSLLLVQPLIVTSLLFALPLAARFGGARPSRTDLGWAALLAVALGVFLAVGRPTAGVDRAGLRDWAPTGLTILGLLVVCIALASARRGRVRALLLACATGLAYGAVAALTKTVVVLLGLGLVPLLTAWETYALVVAVVGGTLLQQSAFQAGDLTASLPAVTVGEPVVAAVIGLTVFGERLRANGPEWVLIGVLVAVMVVATVMLARSSARPAPSPTPEPAGP